MKDAKKHYESLGLKTIPIKDVKAKNPSVTGWNEQDFQWDESTVPHQGIGVLTGSRSNLTVVDFDDLSKSGAPTAEETEQYQALLDLMNEQCTTIVETQNKGRHFYFQYDSRQKQTQGFIKGVDIRNDGGYVVAPPTPGYRFITGDPIPPFKTLPYDLMQDIRNQHLPSQKRTQQQQAMPGFAPSGKEIIARTKRESTVCRVFGAYKAANLTQEEALAAFNVKYEIVWGEEWTPDYLENKVRHFWTQGVWDDKPETLRDAIKGIIFKKDMLPMDRNLTLAYALLPYTYIHKDGSLYVLENDNQDPIELNGWMRSIGLGRNMTKDLYGNIEAVATRKHHDQIIVNYFHYNRVENAVYLNSSNGVMRVDASGARIVPRPDKVIFLKQYNYIRQPKHTLADFVSTLKLDADRTPPEFAEGLIRCWALSVIFNLPHKAHLLIEGSYGAGKTTLACIIVRSIAPDSEPQAINKKQLDFQLSKYDVCLLDNIEARYSDEVRDIIAGSSTGGIKVSRKLFSDNEMTIRDLASHVVFTSMSGAFSNRPDIASRLLPIHLYRRNNSGYKEIDIDYWASVVFFDVLDNLPLVLSNESTHINSRIRNAFFANFCARCGFDLARYEDLILDSQMEHGELVLINDLLRVIDHLKGSGSQTAFVSAGELLDSLKTIHPDKYLDYSSQKLGHILKQIVASHQFQSRYIVDVKSKGANHCYSFRKKL